MRNIGGKKPSKIKEVLLTHIKNNIRQYSIALLLFLIGVILGIIFVNNATQIQIDEITTYLQEFIEALKTNSQIDKGALLKEGLVSNLFLVLTLWFVGSTVIGAPIVYGIVIYRGFCLGYTISSAIATLGLGKRSLIYFYFFAASKYYIYSMYISISGKWNETVSSHYER